MLKEKENKTLTSQQMRDKIDEVLAKDYDGESSIEETLLNIRKKQIQKTHLQSPKYTKNFVIMGAPGSGKGTLTRKLNEEFGNISISTGDALRTHRKAKTKIGNEVSSLLSTGLLVPDEIVNEIVRQEIINVAQTAAGFVLDGYPRNAQQLSFLHRKAGDIIHGVIFLHITTQQVQKRLKNRRMCNTCNISYNYNFNLAEGAKKCPSCGDKLIFREDDSDPNVIAKRMEIFEKDTQPLLHFYQQQNLLYSFDATLDPADICQRIKEVFYNEIETKKPEELMFWDQETQEKFLWSMVRLSSIDYNYGVDKQKYQNEFEQLKKYYPWPLEGEEVLESDFEELPITPQQPNIKIQSKIESPEERSMRKIILQRLLEERDKERKSSLYEGVDESDEFDKLVIDENTGEIIEIIEEKDDSEDEEK